MPSTALMASGFRACTPTTTSKRRCPSACPPPLARLRPPQKADSHLYSTALLGIRFSCLHAYHRLKNGRPPPGRCPATSLSFQARLCSKSRGVHFSVSWVFQAPTTSRHTLRRAGKRPKTRFEGSDIRFSLLCPGPSQKRMPWLVSGPDRVHPVRALGPLCWASGLRLLSFCSILRSFCSHLVFILPSSWPHLAFILPSSCLHFALTLPSSCLHLALILPSSCSNFAFILISSCPHLANQAAH